MPKKYKIGYHHLFWYDDNKYVYSYGILSNTDGNNYYCNAMPCYNQGWYNNCEPMTRLQFDKFAELHERKYVIISRKHSESNLLMFWCPKFSGYTSSFLKAGRYAINEFKEHYGNDVCCKGKKGIFNSYKPLKIKNSWFQDFKYFDSVLVDAAELERFLLEQKR